MVNEAFGEDVSKHIDHLEISDNNAQDNAMMFNHPQSMDVFKGVMELQKMKIQAGDRHGH